MKKDPGVFLGHILDKIELIESYSRGRTELDLMDGVQVHSAFKSAQAFGIDEVPAVSSLKKLTSTKDIHIS